MVALALLSGLFLLRVLAQAVQADAADEIALLPGFHAWQSGAVPYAALLAMQVITLTGMGLGLWLVARGWGHAGAGKILYVLALVYMTIMLVRLVIGYFLVGAETADNWFNRPLPTAFHLVIAGYLLVLGWHWATGGMHHGRQPARWSRLPGQWGPVLAWPATMALGIILFDWQVCEGINMTFATYLSVLLAASTIVVLEQVQPNRPAWRPDRPTVGHDAVYLVLVQVMLPALLAAGAVALADRITDLASWRSIWPHHWPVVAQAALMLVTADFGRYWLHRLAHSWAPLWALHAVHHAPRQLYFLNVGRFHPLDKALQFLLDALPFALLAVGPEVMAVYFVFYAINGFFQHSNASVKLGPLNHVVAGPELHRWHHARDLPDADCNFGNNLIIWDTLFGTRRLPPDRQVGPLGIGNPDYPTSFARQCLAPFRASPDHAQNDGPAS